MKQCGAPNIDGGRCGLPAKTEAHLPRPAVWGRWHMSEDGSMWRLTPDDVSAWSAPHRAETGWLHRFLGPVVRRVESWIGAQR